MSQITESARATKTAPVTPEDNAASPLHALFTTALQTMLSAEQQIAEALVQMQQQATQIALRDGFGRHMGETQIHAERLQKALAITGTPVSGNICKATKALIECGQEMVMASPAGSATRDVALVISAQKVEHFEIATYGGLIQMAKMLGYNEIVGLLDSSMREEYGADKLLTLSAESGLNYTAAKETI